MNSKEIMNFRLSRNWNQFQMAQYLGVTQATVSRWENGAASMNGSALKLMQLLMREAAWPDAIERPDAGDRIEEET